MDPLLQDIFLKSLQQSIDERESHDGMRRQTPTVIQCQVIRRPQIVVQKSNIPEFDISDPRDKRETRSRSSGPRYNTQRSIPWREHLPEKKIMYPLKIEELVDDYNEDEEDNENDTRDNEGYQNRQDNQDTRRVTIRRIARTPRTQVDFLQKTGEDRPALISPRSEETQPYLKWKSSQSLMLSLPISEAYQKFTQLFNDKTPHKKGTSSMNVT